MEALSLTGPLNDTIVERGRRIRLSLAFDRVLLVFRAWEDKELTEGQQLEITEAQLFAHRRDRRWAARREPKEREALITRVFKEYINTEAHKGKDGPRAIDFSADAPYIYASFRYAYGIDLERERGRMDWREFIALLQGLPEDAKINEVIGIRLRPLPEPNQYNADEIQALQEAKEYFALPVAPGEKKGYKQNLAELFGELAGMAKS